MVRAEQTRIQDAIIESELKLSPPGRAFPVMIDRTTMTGVESVLRGELSVCADDDGRLKLADTEGVDILGLFGKFWNGARAQSVNGKPREVTLSEREIGYISGLSSRSHIALTKKQGQALGDFKSASDKVMGKDKKKKGKKSEGKRSASAWFDARW